MNKDTIYFIPVSLKCPFCREVGVETVLGPFAIFLKWDYFTCHLGHTVTLKDCGKQFALIKDVEEAK